MADPEGKSLHIEIAYAQEQNVHVIPVEVADGTTIEQAIKHSGLLDICPEIDLFKNKVGIFSRIRELDSLVRDGDRVEIYRPLVADPKEARRQRAEQQRNNNH